MGGSRGRPEHNDGERLILYNGATGGLGRHVRGAGERAQQSTQDIGTRLHDRDGLMATLDAIPAPAALTFIHLAAMVSVPACESDPALARAINVDAAVQTVHAVAEWAIRHGTPCRVILASTGHVYAVSPPGSRIAESATVNPRSIYASTKLAAERQLASLASGLGIELVIARIFGLIAPVQPNHYVLPGLIHRALDGRLEDIPGLDNVRDYLDARDVCDALLALATCPVPSACTLVNVCSGNPVSVRDLLRAVLEVLDPGQALSRSSLATPAPGRPDDVPWLVGDPTLLQGLIEAPLALTPLKATVADAIAVVIETGSVT